MAHRIGRKEEGRARILKSAGRVFRSHGFGGSTVDGLAREAAVTSGAFYAHFRSKTEAFREAIAIGLEDLRRYIEQIRLRDGNRWWIHFIDFYLGDRRTCDLSGSCALQSLSSDMARADEDARQAYESNLQSIIEAMSKESGIGDEQAITLLALLVGGVTLARAVHSPAASDEIACAVRKTAMTLGPGLQAVKPSPKHQSDT